jgi:FdhD protein
VAALSKRQTLHRKTHATHAAAFIRQGKGVAIVREDVGRHNALDKLAGAIARSGIDASQGALVITSRVSVEMVQKAAAIGAPVLIAVSAPTALAVRTAEAANITLIGVARQSDWEMYTHGSRIHLT